MTTDNTEVRVQAMLTRKEAKVLARRAKELGLSMSATARLILTGKADALGKKKK